MLNSFQEEKQIRQQQQQQQLANINTNNSDCIGNGNRTNQTNQQLAAITAKNSEVTFKYTKKDNTMAVQKDDNGTNVPRSNDRLKQRVLSSSSGRSCSGGVSGSGIESGNCGVSGVIVKEYISDGRVADNTAGIESILSVGSKNPLTSKRCSVSTSNLLQGRRDSVGSGVNNSAARGDGGDQVIKMRRQRLQQQSSQQSQRSLKHHHRTTANEKTKRSCDNFNDSQSTMHSGSKRPVTAARGFARNSSDSSTSSSSSGSSCSGSCISDDGDSSSTSSGVPNLPYPGFTAIAFKYLTQDTRPRNWCLMFITNPWFERISILIILLNCITLGMYQPCVDDACVTNRCKILQIIDDIIFAFFALEMSIKMVAMGLYGKDTYLADAWNRLDCLIVFAGLLEYVMHVENLNLTAIRTIRVLRPLRAINRIPSMRILVMLLLDTLPMLGNVLLLCFFVFFIFGIVGVQLWEGILRQRCVIDLPQNVPKPKGLHDEFRVRVRVNSISFYYEFSKEQDYICSKPEDSGMHLCADLPQYRIGPMLCNDSAVPFSMNYPTTNSCVNWNQYYTNCSQSGGNPFQGTISFDNIGMAWVAIFLVISLEGWTDIMYYVQDAHSFWDWIYFVLLIVIGSFFMINLCLVVIATQFSETKKREMERMRQERARYTSTSTLASSTNNSEPATCYAEIVKYIAHLWRRFKRRLAKKYRLYKCQQQQRKDGLLPNTENLTFSPSRIKNHHPKCPKLPKKPSNIQDQMITVMVPLNSNNNRSLQASVQNLTMPTNIHNNNNINHHNSGGGNGNGNGNVNGNNSNSGSGGGNGTVGVGGGGVGSNTGIIIASNGYNSSPENSEISLETSGRNSNLKRTNHARDENSQKPILLKIPSGTESDQLINPSTSGFLSPPTSARRRSSVMFNEYVILHAPPTIPEPTPDKNVCSSEKMTQAGDGSIWQVNLPQTLGTNGNPYNDCSELGIHDAMTCQELLAFSVAFSAALPTGHSTLESFYTSLAHYNSANDEIIKNQQNIENSHNLITRPPTGNYIEDFACCYDLYQNTLSPQEEKKPIKSKCLRSIIYIYYCLAKCFNFQRKYIKRLVEHKYFQQGILLAILINTLSMGIEYHDQPAELTAIVETSNVIFSAIFAIEMLLKVVAEGPFSYIANGFNVFDGIIVILGGIEICQPNLGDGGSTSSGLSVLRTFRLLRILKLVRFMPNLRRQLFVMLRTMDNVAVFFSLLVLFIFIFSILGMNLFGCKFCEKVKGEVLCDRKNFDSLLWALVTVFQILTQEDWNVVLFNGMEKTSHWAALYFVTLMTFGNYVLFNLLVAILVEGFSSERNERREREQRELVKKLREETLAENFSDVLFDESRSTSDTSSTNESYYEVQNKWHSAEDIRKLNEQNDTQTDPKCNIQKQRLLQPNLDYQLNDTSMTRKSSDKDVSKLNDDDRRALKKTYSIKERRIESAKLSKLRPLPNPPIIMTTAATPQDSPNTTLDNGSGFRNWSQEELELAASMRSISETVLKSESSSSLLKPPSLISGPRAFDEGIPSIEFIPPSPIVERKPINILNANSLGSSTSINHLGQTRLLTDDKSKLSSSSIYSSIASARGGIGSLTTGEENNDVATTSRDYKLKPIEQPSSLSSSTIQIPRTPSFRRFRRTSSKRKKGDNAQDEENIILNNGRDSSQLLRRNDSILRSTNRIQNNTKDTNKLSPQNSIRRMSTASTSRRSSCVYNNSQLYQNLNRHNSIKNYSKRRMSSIEIALGKSSNLNLYNLESRKSISYANSKIDLEKWQKSLSSLNEPETQRAKRQHSISYNRQQRESTSSANGPQQGQGAPTEHVSKLKILIERLKPKQFMEQHEDDSLYIFPEDNRFRQICTWFVNQKWFDNVVLLFIALNCITLAMERPNIPPTCSERVFLSTANYVFTVVFTLEMFIKVVAAGMFYGPDAYFTSGWNIMDGSLVTISIIDLLMSLISESSPRIFGILRVFRLLRSLRPLRVINRAPGLKLVVQTLLSSLRPIGNIVLICCTFFIIFGILGVQLFKGTFYFCEGENTKGVRNKDDCQEIDGNVWINRKYNFDDLGKALMSLFVLSSRDGWVNIMYTGLDAVGVDQQPIVNYNEWRLLYFIAFILLVGFFVLNMFVGVVVENFHRCREEQEKEEKIRRAAKRALQMEKKRRQMHMPPYYTNYSPTRLFVHSVVTSKYFDLAIAAVIGLNVVTMALEYYKMPVPLEYALKIFNYFFTAVFILEAIMKLVALGWRLYMKDKWNQLDVGIVILSIVGIVLEELKTNIIPINPTIIRVMRVLRIARVLKLLKMAKGIRALLDTVMQALPQVGNLGLLFFLLFFIFAALGVELFGRLECSDEIPCQGLGEHAHFANFGMAFLTLFRVATGDNWNGIMKDTLRDNCDDAADCVRNCCVSSLIAPIFFVIFVLMAQFVLVNVVVAVLMKHLEESHKQMEDEMDMDYELERELVREQEFEEEQALCMQLQAEEIKVKRPLEKVSSLPSNFTYSTPSLDKKFTNTQRRQTVQYLNQTELLLSGIAKPARAKFGARSSISEEATESVGGSVGGGVDIEGKQISMQDIGFQVPGGRRGKRGSLLRKKRMLGKERSLDEQGIRERYLESKRMSCDSLPWGGDTRKTTIFESTESETGGAADYDIRSVKSENCPLTQPLDMTVSDQTISHSPLPQPSLELQLPVKTPITKYTAERKQQFGRSFSTDQTINLAPPRTTTLLLSVPRSMPPRSRSGSTKQLFKQQALDEDPDMDESSLLLPVSSPKSQLLEKPPSEKVEGMSKSDSAEIMRIISERRRMDKIDSCGNEDSDYNELLLVKSSHSSIDG